MTMMMMMAMAMAMMYSNQILLTITKINTKKNQKKREDFPSSSFSS